MDEFIGEYLTRTKRGQAVIPEGTKNDLEFNHVVTLLQLSTVSPASKKSPSLFLSSHILTYQLAEEVIFTLFVAFTRRFKGSPTPSSSSHATSHVPITDVQTLVSSPFAFTQGVQASS
jgi:hypothetical protein